MTVNATDLSCPLCGEPKRLRGTYLPPSRRVYQGEVMEFGGNIEEEATEFIGEACEVDCENCGFIFNFHTDQEP